MSSYPGDERFASEETSRRNAQMNESDRIVQRHLKKEEAKIKAAALKFIRAVLPGMFIIAHGENNRHGVADWSLSMNTITSWLEVKHATPSFKSRGIQVITCQRLAMTGRCRYLIFQIDSVGNKRTCIVHPKDVVFGVNSSFTIESAAQGYNYAFIVDYLKKVHAL